MNANDIFLLKEKLQQSQLELKELEQSLKSSSATVMLDQNSVGRLSRMDAMQAQQMAIEAERRRKINTIQIELALKRIENDDYGYCEVCDEEIILGRLQIDPTATKCVKCSE